MNIDELRSQVIVEHQAEVEAWVEQKKASLKQSLADQLQNNKAEFDKLNAELEALEPQAEEVAETPADEVVEPEVQG